MFSNGFQRFSGSCSELHKVLNTEHQNDDFSIGFIRFLVVPEGTTKMRVFECLVTLFQDSVQNSYETGQNT